MKYFLYYLIIINCITFIVYGFDKLMAKMKKSRVSEKVLLNFSIFGGGYGGFLAMIVFSHKTKVNRFIIINLLMIVLYTALFLYFKEYVWS